MVLQTEECFFGMTQNEVSGEVNGVVQHVQIMDALGTRSHEFRTAHDDMFSVAELTATLASGTRETVDVLSMRSERAGKAETSTNADKVWSLQRGREAHGGGDYAFDDFVADGKVLRLRKSILDGGELPRDRTAVLRCLSGVFDVLNKKGR